MNNGDKKICPHVNYSVGWMGVRRMDKHNTSVNYTHYMSKVDKNYTNKKNLTKTMEQTEAVKRRLGDDGRRTCYFNRVVF